MATGAIAAGVIGGSMAVGGIGAAIAANRQKADPRRVYYGGSADALDDQRRAYADQTDAGNAVTGAGLAGLSGAGATGQTISQRGLSLLDSAPGLRTGRAASMLADYRPGEASTAAARAAADQIARQNIGAARVGGALGLRDAMYANSAAGAQVAQQAAAQRAQEEERLLAARVAQENEGVQQSALGQQLRLQSMGLGSQLATSGNAQALSAAAQTVGAGQNQEQLYLDALQNADRNQFSADMDYEQRRQAERQRRSDRLWQLGGSLITGGAAIAANGAGSYGGGGNKGASNGNKGGGK